MLSVPILFLVFNRLDTTKLVFAKIREIKPKQLFIGSDGAREGKEGEKEKVELVRNYILDNIDWECEVKTLFREKNLGCRLAVAQAITWFFDHVEYGIILEDDCVPNLYFFTFCQQLLDRYKDNTNIYAITGCNFQDKKYGNASYYFACYFHVWGWATWKRAWQQFDLDLTDYKDFIESDYLKQLALNKEQEQFWITTFERLLQSRYDTWDYQWMYSIYKNNGLVIVPNVNLVRNIGWGAEATHTFDKFNHLSNRKTEAITRLIHPDKIYRNKEADNFYFETAMIFRTSLKEKLIYKIKLELQKIKKIFSPIFFINIYINTFL
jgi:hypothetical protein